MTVPAALRYAGLLSLAVLLLLSGGCARYDRLMDDCLRDAEAGRPRDALARLEKSPLAGSDRDRLLYLMERGQLQYLAGDYRGSIATLEEADALIEDLVTRSLSRESFSFVSNDKVIPYSGEDFETAYIHYVKALAFLALQDLEGAAVEARKLDLKLTHLGDRYGEKNVYQEDGFLRLLSGLIFEASGDDNNAFIAYRKSLAAYRKYRNKYAQPVPDLLWPRLVATAGRMGFFAERDQYLAMAGDLAGGTTQRGALVVVLVDKGCIPVKHQITALVPSGQGFPVALALPEYRDRGAAVPSVRVRSGQGAWVDARQVQSLAAIARQSLEDKVGRLLAKTVARVAAKQVAARAAQKELGPLAGVLAQVGALISEQADLRGWSMLPRTIDMAVLPAEGPASEVEISAAGRLLSYPVQAAGGGISFVHARIF